MSLVVLCPSRNNPTALLEAGQSFLQTKRADDTAFVPVIDSDDPDLSKYLAVCGEMFDPLVVFEPGSMNAALNMTAPSAADKADIVGFIGDDHRFRTPGWDQSIEMVMNEYGGGIVYGDDLAQRWRLPTQVFISAAIIKALGWMGLPGARHLYLDDTWRVLGENAECLYFLEDIIIEHLHPAYGKAEWDLNHLRVNTQDNYQHDHTVFQLWMENTMEADVQRVRDALARPVAR